MDDIKCQWEFKDRGCTCASDPGWLARFLDRIEAAGVYCDNGVWVGNDDDEESEE